MTLYEILRGKPARIVSLPPSATAAQAAALMKAERVGSIVVTDENRRMVGVLSERHLALAIATRGARLSRTPVGELASLAAPTASEGDSVRDVIRTMTEGHARHIPVLEGGAVVGVISIGDLMKARLAEKSQENAVLQDLARARLPA